MDQQLESELIRLTENAALRREGLLISGLRKSRLRKALNATAGVLALLSAGTITGVIADFFGDNNVQLLAAVVAGVSGTISLIVTAYFSDDETVAMLIGSSKYLGLRESVYRLVVNPRISDEERFRSLADLQDEYARLDETYSRFFPLGNRSESTRPPIEYRYSTRIRRAARADISKLQDKLREHDRAESP
jgi:hypothetical protein